jgi:predicted DNA-binding transcriptional regulator AlpA
MRCIASPAHFGYSHFSMTKPTAPEPLRSEKRYWTVKDAARYLGMTPNTIYSWINPDTQKRPAQLPSGPPPPVYRFGTRQGIRLPIKEFIAWIENFRQGPE